MEQQSPAQRPMTLEEICQSMRAECKSLEKRTREVYCSIGSGNKEQAYRGQLDEMQEQAMLAVRHLEDARMRLGKVIQYAGDGISCYDK